MKHAAIIVELDLSNLKGELLKNSTLFPICMAIPDIVVVDW